MIKLTIPSVLALACIAASPTVIAKPKVIPAGYSVETIETPKDAQGRPLQFGIGSLAAAKDGTLFIASRVEGIWTYKDGTWKRFADGLHDPQGILVAKDGKSVIVSQKPEITRISDTDGDGVADRYETLCDSWKYSGNYCEYVHGLVQDKAGNMYANLNLAHGGNKAGGSFMGTTGGYDGWAIQITPEGEMVPFAHGQRSPAGIGIDPRNDMLFFTDNQGSWVPSSTLHHLRKGHFYGYPASFVDTPDYKKGMERDVDMFTKLLTPPILYFPHGELASSPGNPVIDLSEGKFGPFKGQVIIGDQTRSNIMHANIEKIDGEYQGAVFNMVDALQCGAVRIAFAPDGALWVGQTGRGWRSVGGKMFGVEVLRWDGKTTPFELHSMNITESGFKVNFTSPLTEESARNPKAFSFKSWGYTYHRKYGSHKVDPESPETKLVSVAKDRMSVTVSVPLKTGRVYQLVTNGIKSDEGKAMTTTTGYYTVNRLLK